MKELDDEARREFLDMLQRHWAQVQAEALVIAERTGNRMQRERAHELVNEAVLRVFEGRRTWKQRVHFSSYMGWIMRSIASSEWKRLRRQVPLRDVPMATTTRSPLEFLQDQLDRDRLEALLEEVAHTATGDSLCEQVVHAYLSGECDRPRHVAMSLGVPERAVYAAQRKLGRRVRAAKRKLARAAARS